MPYTEPSNVRTCAIDGKHVEEVCHLGCQRALGRAVYGEGGSITAVTVAIRCRLQ